MDLSRFSIDPALLAGSGADDHYKLVFYDKLLSGLFEQDENLFVKTDLEKERSSILLFPVLHWLTKGKGAKGRSRVLYLCAENSAAEAVYAEAKRLVSAMPGLVAPALLGGAGLGCTGSDLLVADIDSLMEAIAVPEFQPRSFGFIVVDQAELLAELPGELLRTIQGRLLPSRERKTLVVTAKYSSKAKNFAWDFADNPKEIKLGETMGFAGTMEAVSMDVAEGDKIRCILDLLSKVENRHLCVFCNLKSTASELSARLVVNGVASDYIAGNLNIDRKLQIVTKARDWNGKRSFRAEQLGGDSAEAEFAKAEFAKAEPVLASFAASRFPVDSFVLVLTDEGAKGIVTPFFATVINYDIPLEPEFYFERLNLLERDAPHAALFNLVCERYMYGIPAIERLIDASLAVAPLEDKASLPVDVSVGKTIELPESRRRPDDHSDRRPPRNERPRGPAETLAKAPARVPAKAPAKALPTGKSPPIVKAPPTGKARLTGKAPTPGKAPSSVKAPPTDRTPTPTKVPSPVNPYALSMEERMVLYRKKYGQAMDGPGKPRQNSQPRNHASAVKASTQELPVREAATRVAPVPVPVLAQAPAKAPEVFAPAPEVAHQQDEKARSFLGKIQDLFGSRKSE